MAQITNPKNDRRSLTHNFNEIEASNGTRSQNSTGQNSPILEWTCPRKFSRIRYAGGRHKTKFVPRYYQEVSSASGGEEDITVSDILQPIVGETDQDDQPYAPVVAYNETQAVDITDDLTYDYSANVVTLPSGTSSSDTVHLYPIMVSGTLQYRGLDQFGHEIAPLDEWSTQLHVFHDFDQNQNDTEIHLIGAIEWTESETLALYLDAPEQIVWEDTNYPRGQYVSLIEQRVDVSV